MACRGSGLKVLIHGLGVEGRAAIRHFAGLGADIVTIDAGGGHADGVEAIDEAAARALLGPDLLYLRSPGVPLGDPLYAEAVAKGATITTPTGWWLAHHAPPGTIGITGTKGKSTTSALTAAALRAAGTTSTAYGNIGEPPLRAALPAEEAPVIELSSYMCADLLEPPSRSRWRHAVTNLYKEHTTWHGSEGAYRQAKLRPYRWAPPCPGVAPEAVIAAEGLPASIVPIERQTSLDGTVLSINGDAVDLATLSDAFLSPGLRLAARAAAAILYPVLGPSTLGALVAAGRTWTGLPSRQAAVPSTDGRFWIDDALATVPEAVSQALDRFGDRPVRLILGGKDRGQNLNPLMAQVAEGDDIRAFGFGEVSGQIASGGGTVRPSFEEAITAARDDCPPGGVVLFSPAAPSGPPHADYRERAAIFARLASEG